MLCLLVECEANSFLVMGGHHDGHLSLGSLEDVAHGLRQHFLIHGRGGFIRRVYGVLVTNSGRFLDKKGLK